MASIKLNNNSSELVDYYATQSNNNSSDRYKRHLSIGQSLSEASNIIHALKPIRNAEFYQQLSNKEFNDCSKRLHMKLNAYRVNRADNAIHNADRLFVSSSGKPYKLLASKGRFPSEQLAIFPRESIPPSSLYSSGRRSLYFKPWEIPAEY